MHISIFSFNAILLYASIPTWVVWQLGTLVESTFRQEPVAVDGILAKDQRHSPPIPAKIVGREEEDVSIRILEIFMDLDHCPLLRF